MTTKTIQEYQAKQELFDKKNIVTESTDHVDLDTMDKETLQQIIKWAKLCNIPECDLPHNIQELANKESLCIYAYTHALPQAIGSLTHLKSLSLKNRESLKNGVEDRVPDSIGNLVNLKDLNITNDILNELTESIGHLTGLKQLQLICPNLIELPESMDQLKALTELTINSNRLKELPKSICKLTSLTQLTLICHNLESIPESIGELTELTTLIVASDKINHLPKSIENLTKLRYLELNRELTTKIPESLVDKFRSKDLYLSGVPAAALYKPDTDNFPLSIIGCFIISDGWDKQALLKLKKCVGAEFLVGLRTDDSEFERLDIVKGVIKCQLNEVNDIIRLLDVNSSFMHVGTDIMDVITLFECGQSFQFIQASAKSKSELEVAKVATQLLISQLAKGGHIKGLFAMVESFESLSIDTWNYISQAVENLLSSDDDPLYYASSITGEPDCFRLKAIYAEE